MTPDAPEASGDRSVSSGRAVDLAPSLRLPGEHFVAALVFFGLGAAGLAWMADPLARGAFAHPGVAGVAHLFTLGWLTTSIMGALYQLLPVAMRAPVGSESLGHLCFWLYVPGVAGLAGGLAGGSPPAIGVGATLAGLALLLFLGNLTAALIRAPRRDLTWACVAAAGVFLLAALSLGLILVANLRTGLLGGGRGLVLSLHVHLAAGGWVLLVIVGVGHRLLPMFLHVREAPAWPGRIAAAAVGGGAGVLLLLHHLLDTRFVWVGYALLGLGTAAFLLQTGLWYRHRLRPRIEPALRLAGAGLALLGAALILGMSILVAGDAGPRRVTAYGVTLLVGGLGLFVAGIYYKILPFLTWYHRFGPVAAEREVPTAAELLDARAATAAALLLNVGVIGIAVGILAGSAAAVRAAALVFLGGSMVLIGQMAGLARRKP